MGITQYDPLTVITSPILETDLGLSKDTSAKRSPTGARSSPVPSPGLPRPGYSTWSSNRQHQYHLGACYKCKVPGLTTNSLNRNLHFNKILRRLVRILSFEKHSLDLLSPVPLGMTTPLQAKLLVPNQLLFCFYCLHCDPCWPIPTLLTQVSLYFWLLIPPSF